MFYRPYVFTKDGKGVRNYKRATLFGSRDADRSSTE